MSKFTDFSGINQIGGHRYRLTSDLLFEVGKRGSGFSYVVPAGFVFDVSIPIGVRWLFNPDDIRYLKASAVHDHMWINGWDLQTAAAIFYRALRSSYVPAWRAMAMYAAVSAYSLLLADQTSKGLLK